MSARPSKGQWRSSKNFLPLVLVIKVVQNMFFQRPIMPPHFWAWDSLCDVLIFLICQKYCVNLLLQKVQKVVDFRSKDPHCAIDYLNHAFALLSVQLWSFRILTEKTETNKIANSPHLNNYFWRLSVLHLVFQVTTQNVCH